MIRGFKEFIMRGNVVDLAVGIAVGVAFTTLVGAFGTHFVNPIVAVAGGDDPKGFGFEITNESTFVNVGGLINALIVFLVTMAVIYFAIVVPVQKLQGLRKRGEEPPDEVPEDITLLREIRDALQRRSTT
jgi:large conductance mechanosensitive channel